MNIQQIRNAQNALRAAIAICEAKGGLVAAANVANQAWIDAGEPYPLPVGEYRRYSWLMADLTRMQMQLCEALRDAELEAGYPVDEETGCDLREWSGNEIEAAHTDALVMDAEIDILARKLADRRCYWMSAEHIANVQQEDIDSYKRHAFDNGPRVAQHIIKVIVIAKRIAKTLTGYLEHEPKPAPDQMVEASEIPF